MITNLSELRGNTSSTAVDASVAAKDNFIDVDTTTGDITITLEDFADARAGREIRIRKLDVSVNTVIIQGDTNIDGAATLVLATQYDVATVVKGSVEWVSA